jgi:hypothetical protein
MAIDPSPLHEDGGLLEQVRLKLSRPTPKAHHWAALAAAAFFAICAIGFAVAAVLAPPLSHDPAAKSSVR